MSVELTEPPSTRSSRPVFILAWIITLLITLPDILFREITGQTSAWLVWFKLGALVILFLVGFFWQAARPLRSYLAVFILLITFEGLSARIGASSLWKSWFPVTSSFSSSMLGAQLLRMGVTAAMIAVLWSIKKRPSRFYLVKGQPDVMAAPIPWLMTKPTSWKKLGGILCLCISGGTLLFLLLAGRPDQDTLLRAVPLLPFVLLFALMNSFSEELDYRASLLSTLEGAVTKDQALVLSAAYFGILHFYGVPYGILGVIMAGALGWFLGKSMLETRGFFWAWMIHFLQDVLIFSFLAIGSIVPGG
jgi:uncharacterized protein